MSDEGIKAKGMCRSMRLIAGIFMTVEGTRHLFGSSPGFPLKTTGVVAGELIFYLALHLVISKFSRRVNPWLGAVLAVAPVVLVFIYGGPAGRLGTLIYVGVSLVLTAIRSDGGCEVMTVPGMILGNRTHLVCIVFSPIDWVEAKLTNLLRGPTGSA
jgi:hypothetical protein